MNTPVSESRLAQKRTWPVEPYTRNEGSVGRRKITFVGASYKFVHKVLRDMILVGGFNEVELCVHDINAEPIRVVGDLLEKMARQAGTRIRITRTLSQTDALRDADVVILAITTGGPEADRRAAEATLKHGIPVGIGDTLGPTALARNLRTIPVVVDLVQRMEKLCPRAVMLNFTNPMSAITGAMARHSSIPCWGLCHSGDELFNYFARVFGCAKSDLELDVGGVNHQSFVTRLVVRGEDRTREILQATTASDAMLEDNLLETRREDVDLQQDLFRLLGAWPSCGGAHLAEFYEYFFTGRPERFAATLKTVAPDRPPLGPKPPPPILLEWTYGDGPVGDMDLLTTEHAHELMWAALTGESFTRVLNVLNTGNYLEGIAADACVEASVTISGKTVRGRSLRLPAAIHSLVQRWTTIHDLSIFAALNHDRDAARQSLFLDPHVRDFDDIEALLEDLLAANRDWLPPAWFN